MAIGNYADDALLGQARYDLFHGATMIASLEDDNPFKAEAKKKIHEVLLLLGTEETGVAIFSNTPDKEIKNSGINYVD